MHVLAVLTHDGAKLDEQRHEGVIESMHAGFDARQVQPLDDRGIADRSGGF